LARAEGVANGLTILFAEREILEILACNRDGFGRRPVGCHRSVLQTDARVQRWVELEQDLAAVDAYCGLDLSGAEGSKK